MALHVNVPLRVRLVGTMGPYELALLERAVADAAGTALRTARREVLDPRGPRRRTVVDRPAPVFTGAALPAGLRRQVAERVARGLSAGLAAAGVPAPAVPAPAVRTGTRPAEPFDPARAEPPGTEPVDVSGGTGQTAAASSGRPGAATGTYGAYGAYRVPSYDHGGDEVPVPLADPVLARPRTERKAGAGAPGGGPVTWARACEIAWQAHLERSKAVWQPQSHGYPGYAGLIVVDGVVHRALAWITTVRNIQPDGSLRKEDYAAAWHPFRLLQPGRDQTRPSFRFTLPDPSPTFSELTRVDEPPSVELIEQTIDAILAKQQSGRDNPLHDPKTRRRYAEQLMAGLPASYVLCTVHGPRRQFALMPGTIESPIRYVTAPGGQGGEADTAGRGHGGGGVPEPQPKPKAKAKKTAKATPKAPPEPKPEPGTGKPGERKRPGEGKKPGEGEKSTPGGTPPQPAPGEPGGGDRKRGGLLGTHEKGGLWPFSGLAGEPFACVPFEDEPATADLAEGGERLAADMRRIARMLEVPLDVESCAYAGTFALSCARTIGTRARGVGLASVDSTVMTEVTVRPDGGGNNGYVDLRPGQAPELQYMRLLAELVASVHDLGAEVVSAYLSPANARAVNGDRGPRHAAAWALHFLEELSEALSSGCMHLYAETCRVLLLQQLRSSRVAIAARAGDRVEDAVKHFTASLAVYGGGAVELLVLRRALRHAQRTGTTGPVRQVLSTREVVYRPSYFQAADMAPPPIATVSARTLDDLADARIERSGTAWVAVHGGRTWTPATLDRGIDERRAQLNRMDPLFFQIGDLEAVFRETRDDPARIRSYLTGLLADMAKANKELTDQAKSPDDGAFFALEVSHWLEHENHERDERGLWFVMHGIHGMADAELRPFTGDLAVYVEGVNRAISRKAGFDKLKSLFAGVGLVVLALVCAPLAAPEVITVITGALGVAMAHEEYEAAQEMGTAYRSVLYPEALLHWQDVQMAQLVAEIGLAFSVFDVALHTVGGAKAISGRAARLLAEAEEQTAAGAVRTAAGLTRAQIMSRMTTELLNHALRQAVVAGAVVAVMELVVPKVIKPVVMEVLREEARVHGTLGAEDAAAELAKDAEGAEEAQGDGGAGGGGNASGGAGGGTTGVGSAGRGTGGGTTGSASTGSAGDVGDTANTGSAGDVGSQGNTGSPGDTASAGSAGGTP